MAVCEFCGKEFEPKPRFKRFCSTPCKNPRNRPGHSTWNKGLTKEDPRVLRNITSPNRVMKCSGWNKGNVTKRAQEVAKAASERMQANNPNANGVCNKQRPKYTRLDGWDEYVRQVRKFTMRTKRRILQQTSIRFGKYRDDWQLDHIIPIEQGFELNVPPFIIGSNANCQILKQHANRKKWNKKQPPEMVNEIIDYFMETCNGLQ